MTEAAKVIIEVQGGIIVNEPLPDFTRRFTITSSQWEQPDEVMKAYGYAQEYMRNMWNPKALNWVTCMWIFL